MSLTQFTQAPVGAQRLLATWSARRRQRRELMALNDRLLADIGITRAAVLRESLKPFWRA